MKNRFLIATILTLSVVLTSCSSDDTISIDSLDIQQVADVTKDGSWRISSYIDSGKDETSDYNGYSFDFADNGLLSATNGSNTYNGSWSVTNDSSSSSSQDDIDFNIFFSAPENFEELSDDWDIVSVSNSKIELIDVSGGDGETDSLTFIKN